MLTVIKHKKNLCLTFLWVRKGLPWSFWQLERTPSFGDFRKIDSSQMLEVHTTQGVLCWRGTLSPLPWARKKETQGKEIEKLIDSLPYLWHKETHPQFFIRKSFDLRDSTFPNTQSCGANTYSTILSASLVWRNAIRKHIEIVFQESLRKYTEINFLKNCVERGGKVHLVSLNVTNAPVYFCLIYRPFLSHIPKGATPYQGASSRKTDIIMQSLMP